VRAVGRLFARKGRRTRGPQRQFYLGPFQGLKHIAVDLHIRPVGQARKGADLQSPLDNSEQACIGRQLRKESVRAAGYNADFQLLCRECS
jgi:hypothetical protein